MSELRTEPPLPRYRRRIQPGQSVGHYRVVRQIGQGGMGLVFEVVHEEIGRRAALKVLHSHISDNPHIARRFRNEARALTRIQHPGLVQIFDFGHRPDASAYIVMEYLEGETLLTRLARAGGTLPEADVLRIGRQVALALGVAHEAGIVHRDLKPENIMLVGDPELPGGERAKILDFGIARIGQAGENGTRTDAILGTASYMAPEQCRGSAEITDRSDVYALGILLYQMIAGRPPFVAETDVEIMALHIRAEPPPLRSVRAAVSGALADLVGSMLVKQASARPAMAQVAAMLARSEQPAPEGVRRGPPGGVRATVPGARRALTLTVGLGLVAAFLLVPARLGGPRRISTPQTARAASVRSQPPGAAQSRTAGQVRWRIETEPPGAQVLFDGQCVGVTPWEQIRSRSAEKKRVTLKLPAHFKLELSLDGAADETRRATLVPISDQTVLVLDL